jgi:hypothetical protein
MGNHPSADLMVISPSGTSFCIDVKGQYQKNAWLVKRGPRREGLYYVFAFVPDDKPNEYFVLSQDTLFNELEKELASLKSVRGASFDEESYPTYVGWKEALQYKDAWASLPA